MILILTMLFSHANVMYLLLLPWLPFWYKTGWSTTILVTWSISVVNGNNRLPVTLSTVMIEECPWSAQYSVSSNTAIPNGCFKFLENTIWKLEIKYGRMCPQYMDALASSWSKQGHNSRTFPQSNLALSLWSLILSINFKWFA